jgi:hypothetical protein
MIIEAIATVNVGSVFEKVSDCQEIGPERHPEAQILPGRSEIFNTLSDQGEFQTADPHDGLIEFGSKLPAQDPLADSPEIEGKKGDGYHHNQGGYEHN